MRNILEIHNNSGDLQALSMTSYMPLTVGNKTFYSIQSFLADVMEKGICEKRGLREINNMQYKHLRASLLACVESNEQLKSLLLSTRGKYLVFRSLDNFIWGCTPKGIGANKLGVLWEDIRAELITKMAVTNS